MKQLFVSILTVYVFALSVMPCTHAVECGHESSRSTDAISQLHFSVSEHCSPFCTCSCCSCPVVDHNVVLHFEYFLCLNKPVYPVEQGTIISCNSGFWQPPKIG